MRDLLALIWRIVRPGNPVFLRAEDGIMELWRAERFQDIKPAGPFCGYVPHRNVKVTKRARPQIEHTVTRIRARR